jgi:hypothetical protein
MIILSLEGLECQTSPFDNPSQICIRISASCHERPISYRVRKYGYSVTALLICHQNMAAVIECLGLCWWSRNFNSKAVSWLLPCFLPMTRYWLVCQQINPKNTSSRDRGRTEWPKKNYLEKQDDTVFVKRLLINPWWNHMFEGWIPTKDIEQCDRIARRIR